MLKSVSWADTGPYGKSITGNLSGDGFVVQIEEVGFTAAPSDDEHQLDIQLFKDIQGRYDGLFSPVSLDGGISDVDFENRMGWN